MADQEGGGGDEVALSFMDKVRFMMYGEQEKEAFLIEKKEKEEKKKAKALKKAEEKAKKKKAKEEGESSSKVEAPPQNTEEVADVSPSREKE